ncbi:hypothetical protein ACLK1T_05015 [Escherichia coli]
MLGLITTLKNMRDLKGPQFLHIMTKKGRGYEPAEKTPSLSTPCLNLIPPAVVCRKVAAVAELFKNLWRLVVQTAAKDNKLMAITPAMREGSGMVGFRVNSPIVASTWQSPSNTR